MPRNKFEGQCIRCGRSVRPGQGHFERVGRIQKAKYGALVDGKSWIVQHASCAIESRGTNKTFVRNAPNNAPEARVEYVDQSATPYLDLQIPKQSDLTR